MDLVRRRERDTSAGGQRAPQRSKPPPRVGATSVCPCGSDATGDRGPGALYAALCAKMAETNNDETKEMAVAEAEGVPGATWLAGKKGWSDRMMDDAKKPGTLAHAFMPLYQAA